MSDERRPTQWNSGGVLAQLLETLEAAPSTMMTRQPAIVLSPDFAKRAAAALRAIAPPDVGEPLAPRTATEAMLRDQSGWETIEHKWSETVARALGERYGTHWSAHMIDARVVVTALRQPIMEAVRHVVVATRLAPQSSESNARILAGPEKG